MEFSLRPRKPAVRGKLRDEGSKCKRADKPGRHWLGPQETRETTYGWVWVPAGRGHVRTVWGWYAAQLQRELISLIYTLAMTNGSPTGPMRLGGIQARVTPSYATALRIKRERKILPPDEKESSARTSSRTLPPNPHTRSKIIPL